jgi:hypothetical protein
MQINTSKREICRWFLKKLNVNDPAIPVYAWMNQSEHTAMIAAQPCLLKHNLQ